MGKALENLVVSHTDIGLDTFEDKVDSYGYMDVAYGVMQVISWFIFLFGVINLINTTLSNQYSRRQENSVLRSIGLAPKQLAQSLSHFFGFLRIADNVPRVIKISYIWY